MSQQYNTAYMEMKKLLKIFALLTCIATMGIMSSCTKSNEDLIVGKWEVVDPAITTQGVPIQLIWEFSVDGKFAVTSIPISDYSSYVGIYVINGDKLTMTVTDYGYSKLLTNDERTKTVTIENITKTEMSWIMTVTSTNVITGEVSTSDEHVYFKRL